MKSLSLALFGVVVSMGCYNVVVSGTGGSGGSDGQTMTNLPSGCHASKYMLGDPVMYVCSNPLPVTTADGLNSVQVSSFTFVNYRQLWNHITSVCVTNVGETPLDDQILSVTFDVDKWDHAPVTVAGPWSADGRVCMDVPIVIGQESQRTMSVSLNPAWPFEGPVKYRFQITVSTDVTLDDPIKIDGSFPVVCDEVTVTSS